MSDRYFQTNGRIIDGMSGTDTPLRNDELVDKLNGLASDCSRLEKENEELKEFKKRYDVLLVDYNNLACRFEELNEENEQLKHRLSKFQSKYDKSKTDEIEILVETENTILLNKEEFQQYVRRHNELKRHNKRRKQKNKKYRNELKKRLKEISGLKEFIAEDLSSDDKILKGFIEEYL